MADPFNGLTQAEAERLAWLLEELGEAQQAIGKILRHGYERRNPLVADGETNRAALARELGHVLAAAESLDSKRDISWDLLRASLDAKKESVRQWMHHQEAPHD